MSHKFWQTDHVNIRVNCVRGKTTGCYILESLSSISMSEDVLALELLNSVQPSFRCIDEIFCQKLSHPPPF